MSFADELRNYNADAARNRNIQEHLNQDVSLYVGLLKGACIKANINNKKSVSIYAISWLDDGYTENGYIEKLPTVQQETKISQEFNKSRYTNYGRSYVGVGKFECRLFEKLITFEAKDLEYAKILQQQLNIEVRKMGFKTWKIALVELDDIYHLYYT